MNQDAAGAVTNAEDFTKQFMSQLGMGGPNFKPEVKPVGEMPKKPTNPGQTFTKTSLAANKQVCENERGWVDFRLVWQSELCVKFLCAIFSNV